MPRRADRVTSGASPDFDDFYLASRRRLVLSAYALTGDLSAARNAVSDAFVAARHHWRKVGRLPDPEEWVRPRAWAMAQRRHVARLWHREKGLNPDQKAVLDALHHLPDQQRKVLLLAQLAALTPAEIGRELGETEARVEQRLATATGIVLPGDRHRTGVGRRRDRGAGADSGGGGPAGTGDDPPRRPDAPVAAHARRGRRAPRGDAAGRGVRRTRWRRGDRSVRADEGRRQARDRRDAAQPAAGAAARPARGMATGADLGQHQWQRHQLGVPGHPVRRPAGQGHVGAHVRDGRPARQPAARRTDVEISRSPAAVAERPTAPPWAGSPAARRRGCSCSAPTGSGARRARRRC